MTQTSLQPFAAENVAKLLQSTSNEDKAEPEGDHGGLLEMLEKQIADKKGPQV